ncbi:BA14K family protein [Rhizobium sp. Root1220]|uniref:BA14K family protein n=1 Tax=Rhizobium sp. Root1220 TaxID=1736432 RepID=UPI0009EA6E41|nr:BA14K family protein [Rhizobium sp. Root1220]
MRKHAVLMLSLIAAFSAAMPAQAVPFFNRPTFQTSDPQLIQYRRYYPRYGRNYGGQWGGYRNYGRSYYGGYRPYGGYRYGGYGGYYGRGYYGGYYGGGYNDFGLLLGGLATGAIIGGALAQPRYYDAPRYYGNYSHTDWCYSRYRSYRAYDNTFQPYYGPRRQCLGP